MFFLAFVLFCFSVGLAVAGGYLAAFGVLLLIGVVTLVLMYYTDRP